MEIRLANSEDTAGIVELLKLSLGESSSLKTVEYWNWKHIENPFGESPVLIAIENDKIVGVRAFMQWKWCYGQRSYRALRAVDTATHPEYRGKGIFKKLTLALLDQCADYDFVFNTPNEQSRLGYLKMGWKILGRIPVRIKIIRPLQLLQYKFLGNLNIEIPEIPSRWAASHSLGNIENLNCMDTEKNGMHTPVKPSYLKWRYLHCPVQKYYAFKNEGYLFIWYPKVHRWGVEMRIVELFFAKDFDKAKLKKDIKLAQKSCRAVLVSIANIKDEKIKSFLHGQLFYPQLKIGPIMTIKELKTNIINTPMVHWNFRLGEMELF